MATIITLFCMVHGDPVQRAFEIDISNDKSVSCLKDEIKKKKENDFRDIDADKLTLWKVDIPDGDEDAVKNLFKDNKTNGVMLRPIWKISKWFSKLDGEHIHVVIERPTDKKEIRCKATYGRNTAAFQWTPNRENTTLAELKQLLRSLFTFPDGTEDKDIGISRKDDDFLLRLLKDSELASVVWENGYWTELSLVVDTTQQAFSSWDFAKMKIVFGLAANSFSELSTFKVENENVDITKYTRIIDHVMTDILVRFSYYILHVLLK
jgi:hypothetical protein